MLFLKDFKMQKPSIGSNFLTNNLTVKLLEKSCLEFICINKNLHEHNEIDSLIQLLAEFGPVMMSMKGLYKYKITTYLN